MTPLGSTTGLGAGVMNNQEKYSGGIFLDDINKITDTLKNKVLNQSIRDYISTNIFTRLNNKKANILNVQQRISRNDVSQFLLDKYAFLERKIPLLNADGSCNIASQYDSSRIELLKKDAKTFLAQYQQEPPEDIEIAFSGQMFEYETLKESVERRPRWTTNAKRIIGVDPKREGEDNFAIVYREGFFCKVLFNSTKAFYKNEALDVITKYAVMYNVDEICVDSAKAEMFIEELRDLYDDKVREVKFGSESHRVDAVYKRDAMYADLRDWIIRGGVLDNNKELLEDLAAQKLVPRSDNKIKLAPKNEDIKQRLGRSPGLSDALALTFARPEKKNETRKSVVDEILEREQAMDFRKTKSNGIYEKLLQRQ